jgi:hypothetical protein
VTRTAWIPPRRLSGPVTLTAIRCSDPPGHLTGHPPGLLEEHGEGAPDHRALRLALLTRDHRLETQEPVVGLLGVHRGPLGRGWCRGAGSRRKNRPRRSAPLDQGEGGLEILLGLAGKARDEVRAEEEIGARRPQPPNEPEVVGAVCLRFMALRMRSEPDCTGRCRKGMSFSTSPCAAISASSMSLGCEVV